MQWTNMVPTFGYTGDCLGQINHHINQYMHMTDNKKVVTILLNLFSWTSITIL